MSLVFIDHPQHGVSQVGARQGMINKGTAGKRQSGSPGSNKGKSPKLRSGCPVCPPPPTDNSLYAYVGSKSKTATCKNGHVFQVGVGSIPANTSYLISE